MAMLPMEKFIDTSPIFSLGTISNTITTEKAFFAKVMEDCKANGVTTLISGTWNNHFYFTGQFIKVASNINFCIIYPSMTSASYNYFYVGYNGGSTTYGPTKFTGTFIS